MPNLRNARGVLDRSFSFTTYKGRPKYDIKETLEPQGNPARQERLDALNDFRKLMLIYRLLHFKDSIVDINIGVEGREKELSKPVVQLFYGTKAQKEVERTLQAFLNLRNEKKEITLEPILHPIVTKLVSENGNEIYVKQIWWAIKETIEGYSDDKRPHEYQTLEYGTIYNNTISNILEHTFGGRPKHKEHGNLFLFDPEELARVGRSYNLTTKIQTKITIDPEGSEGNEGSTEEPPSSNEDQDDEDIDSPGKTDDNPTSNIQKQIGARVQEPSDPSDPSAKVIERCSYWSPLNEATRQTQEMVFWSRLTELVHKNGGSFTGNELQQRLISTSAYTNVVFLIKEAIENREIEAIEGQFDTYRLIGGT